MHILTLPPRRVPNITIHFTKRRRRGKRRKEVEKKKKNKKIEEEGRIARDGESTILINPVPGSQSRSNRAHDLQGIYIRFSTPGYNSIPLACGPPRFPPRSRSTDSTGGLSTGWKRGPRALASNAVYSLSSRDLRYPAAQGPT